FQAEDGIRDWSVTRVQTCALPICFGELTTGPRIAFFEALAHRFGPDRERLEHAVAAWQSAQSDATAAELHHAAEPRRQELFRRLNLAPGGPKALVALREPLIGAPHPPDDPAPRHPHVL